MNAIGFGRLHLKLFFINNEERSRRFIHMHIRLKETLSRIVSCCPIHKTKYEMCILKAACPNVKIIKKRCTIKANYTENVFNLDHKITAGYKQCDSYITELLKLLIIMWKCVIWHGITAASRLDATRRIARTVLSESFTIANWFTEVQF